MLTARTQSIMHTEYLQPLDPLPTTLDAKKSPLALLAQTCSSIGKPDIPHNTADAKTPSTPHDSRCGKTSPEKGATAASDEKPFDLFKVKREEHSIGKSFSNIGKDSHRTSPSSTAESKPIASATAFTSRSVSPSKSRSEHSTNSSSATVSATDTVTSHSTGISLGCSSLHSDLSHHSSKELKSHSVPIQSSHAPPMLPAAHLTSHAGLAYYKPGQPLFSSAHNCGCSSQLSSHYHHLDSAGLNKTDSNPLVAPGYARVKTADGATTLMPICRDPYCNNCQASQHAVASAASGCTQCRHDSYPLPGAVPLAFPLPGAPFPACPIPTSLASSPSAGLTPYLYPPFSSLPAPAQTEHGHVCNWVSGNTNCGKRFASSEELLQHLRTHTQQNHENSSSYSASELAASLNAQLSAYYMYYPTAATLQGGTLAGFPKPTLPSALSPNSALRYYPYKAPLSAPALTALPGLPAAYYSPYALHDMKSRLASAALPH
ncbi:zinc finger protein 503-like [Apostichopus japonicus]|uniref:zinc finger protein 503-like n=1 Tax=Stichopus japonicus TaxID=307972 RepID=UPI003AB4E03D